MLVVGTLGSELFLTRISLLGAIGGSLLFLFGWQVIRILAFPLGILLLMVPLPAIIFNQITFPLELLRHLSVRGVRAQHIAHSGPTGKA